MSQHGSSIIENVFHVIGKVLSVAIYTCTKALEAVLHGFNNYLQKKIKQ